jgi:hypothetical protein
VNIGDTFVWCPESGLDHLWILISDPNCNAGKCVLVNLTESRHARHSFILHPGQHRFIIKDSDVNFGDAFLTTCENLKRQLSMSAARSHDPLDKAILDDIIKRARTHPGFPPFLRKLLPPP